jgi:Holliday junction resolvase RusA-like endonuclease
MMLLYKTVIHIEPVAQERPRVRVVAMKGRKPFATVYDPKRSKQFKEDLHNKLKHDMMSRDLINEPMILSCRIFIKRPKTVTREYPEVKPDLSNYLKGIEDAMNGAVYTDDSKIVGYGECYKLYTEDIPRIEIELYNIE